MEIKLQNYATVASKRCPVSHIFMVGPGISHKASAIETGWRQENSNPTQFSAAAAAAAAVDE